MEAKMDESFRGMKQILSGLEPYVDVNGVPELKERAHIICARFLGGAWKQITKKEIYLQRLKLLNKYLVDQIKSMSCSRGGMSNMLFLCRLPRTAIPIKHEPDQVLLRVYFNPEIESHLVSESVIFTLLSERHLGPKLYGIFSGGRLEEYIPSRPLSCAELSKSHISSILAKRIARIHRLELPIYKEPYYIIDALYRWLKQIDAGANGTQLITIPDRYSRWAPNTVDCAEIFDQIDFLKKCMSLSTSPVVFCHNDLQEGNILLPKAISENIRQYSLDNEEWCANRISPSSPANPHLIVIDFEYASYNYRGFDFANHFIEYTIDYTIPTHPFYAINRSQFPSKEQQITFFKSYIMENELNLPANVIHEKATTMTEEMLPFIPVSHLFWAVWSFLQVQLSPVGFGFAVLLYCSFYLFD